MRKLVYGKKRPMVGTIRPKGTKEERNRKEYVEKKEKNIEEALRLVQMRNTVWFLCHSTVLTLSGERSDGTDFLNPMHHGIELRDISDSIETCSNRPLLSIKISKLIVISFVMLNHLNIWDELH